MNARTLASRSRRGFTLIEIMVALVLLLVGIVGLMRLQVFGLHANQASRTHTTAVELARELALGLQALPWADTRVDPTVTGTTPTSANFGRILDGGVTNYKTWSDSNFVPGVRLDSEIAERDADGTPTFKRRWTVWSYTDGTGRPSGGKLIAVSVTFHERTGTIPYEVVYYGFQGNAGAVIANAGAYQ